MDQAMKLVIEQVVVDFVGLEDDGGLVDQVQYDNLISECTMHFNSNVPLDKLSEEAKFCCIESESQMKAYSSYEGGIHE